MYTDDNITSKLCNPFSFKTSRVSNNARLSLPLKFSWSEWSWNYGCTFVQPERVCTNTIPAKFSLSIWDAISSNTCDVRNHRGVWSLWPTSPAFLCIPQAANKQERLGHRAALRAARAAAAAHQSLKRWLPARIRQIGCWKAWWRGTFESCPVLTTESAPAQYITWWPIVRDGTGESPRCASQHRTI